MQKIVIHFESFSCEAEIHDTPTGQEILKSLPLECSINTWGNEIYFSIAPNLPLEPDAREITSIGELGYWPSGRAFCIFFGPTPASNNGEPRAVSPVNIFGRITTPDVPTLLRKVSTGEKVLIVKTK